MQPFLDAALDTEASQHDLPVRVVRLSVSHDTSVQVDVSGLWLEHVEVIRTSHAEANIALEVARFVVVSLFTRAVLRKVFGGPHDELSLVNGVSHPLRVYDVTQVPVHRG